MIILGMKRWYARSFRRIACSKFLTEMRKAESSFSVFFRMASAFLAQLAARKCNVPFKIQTQKFSVPALFYGPLISVSAWRTLRITLAPCIEPFDFWVGCDVWSLFFSSRVLSLYKHIHIFFWSWGVRVRLGLFEENTKKFENVTKSMPRPPKPATARVCSRPASGNLHVRFLW